MTRRSASPDEHPDSDCDEEETRGASQVIRRDPFAELLADEHGEQRGDGQRPGGGEEYAEAAGAGCGRKGERRELGLVAQLGQEHARKHQGVGFLA